MKKLFFLLLSFLSSITYAQIDVERYSVNLEFPLSERPVINGIIDAAFHSPASLSEIRFKIYEINIDSIQLPDHSNLEFKISGDTLAVRNPNNAEGLSRLIIYFSYQVSSGQLKKNFYLTLPNVINDLSCYILSAKIRADYEVYANFSLHAEGLSDEYNFYSGQTKNDIMKTSVIIAPKNYYKHLHSNAANIPINLYFKKNADQTEMAKLLHEITNALRYFNDSLGTYLYDGLNIVEDADSTAFYINSQPGLIIASSSMITQKYSQWSYHETAHQWFGSGIYFPSNEGWPVAEPIAEMLKLMCLERFEGADISRQYLNDIKDEYKADYYNTGKDIPLLNSGAGRATYLKGPIIYTGLRKCLGEIRWTEFLRKSYSKYKSGFLTLMNFTNILEDIDPDCAAKFMEDLEAVNIPDQLSRE